MLGTCSCKPLNLKVGPEKMPNGTPEVKWFYEDSKTSNEVIAYWQRADTSPSVEWESLTKEQKELVMHFVNVFAGNLKHYLRHVKEARV